MSEVKYLKNTENIDKDIHIDEEAINIDECLATNNYNEYFLQQALKFIKVNEEEK